MNAGKRACRPILSFDAGVEPEKPSRPRVFRRGRVVSLPQTSYSNYLYTPTANLEHVESLVPFLRILGRPDICPSQGSSPASSGVMGVRSSTLHAHAMYASTAGMMKETMVMVLRVKSPELLLAMVRELWRDATEG